MIHAISQLADPQNERTSQSIAHLTEQTKNLRLPRLRTVRGRQDYARADQDITPAVRISKTSAPLQNIPSQSIHSTIDTDKPDDLDTPYSPLSISNMIQSPHYLLSSTLSSSSSRSCSLRTAYSSTSSATSTDMYTATKYFMMGPDGLGQGDDGSCWGRGWWRWNWDWYWGRALKVVTGGGCSGAVDEELTP